MKVKISATAAAERDEIQHSLFEFFTKLYKTDDIAKGFLYLSLVRILSKLSGKK